MGAHLLIHDVNNIIDDFVRAVIGGSQPCKFETLAGLWYERAFSFLHWASEAPARGLASTPPPNTIQILYRGALTRLVEPSTVHESFVAVKPTVQPAEGAEPTAAFDPQQSNANMSCSVHRVPDTTSSPPTPDEAQESGSDGRVGVPASQGVHGAAPGSCERICRQDGLSGPQPVTRGTVLPTESSQKCANGSTSTARVPCELQSVLPSGQQSPQCLSGGANFILPAFECTHADEEPDVSTVDTCVQSLSAAGAATHQSSRSADHMATVHNEAQQASEGRRGANGSQATASPPAGGASHACGRTAGQAAVDLTMQCEHPFISQVRRKHLIGCDAAECVPGDRRTPGRRPAQEDSSRLRLDLRVVPEAQIAAVYVLYALYGTQPLKPASHIYVSPCHRRGFSQAVTAMKAARVDDGIAMLKALVDADAFVWGLVDCCAAEPGKRPAHGYEAMPHLTQKAQTVTDNAVRQATIHLRQLVPPNSSVRPEHAAYTQSLRHLVASGLGIPATMLQHLPEELAAKFAAAVSNVRHYLASNAAKKRRRLQEEADELGAELDAELQDDDLAEGADVAVAAVASGGGGLASVMKASAERSRRRKLAEQQWRQRVGSLPRLPL